MADLTCTIGRTDIKKIDFNKELSIQPNQQIELKIQTANKVLYNAERPLQALVHTTITIKDEKNDLLHFTFEFITPVVASSFIDNLEELVKKQYVPIVNVIAAEKVKEITTYVGTAINLPGVAIAVNPDVMGS